MNLSTDRATAGTQVMSSGSNDLPKIYYEKYTLANGLEVILHQDHSIPMVAVNIWYHVGSKDEKPGRTGFAHLFEHMMFEGSKHHDADYFRPLEKIGGSVNGSTSEDRTNYWEIVPSNYLELALWLESDRMGYLLPAITQAKLETQRNIVKNERRQAVDNQPYGKAEELLLSMLFPADHPYSWPVIGKMEDISSACLEDVANFFKTYYRPNNTSLCIAGAIDPIVTQKLVEKYFGTIVPGPPIERFTTWLPELTNEKRMLAEDNVNLPRLYYMWHTPPYYTPGDAEFDLLAEILAAGKTSRLYKALVYEQQIAQDVSANQVSRELGSIFSITVTARAGRSLAELEQAVDVELKKIIDGGVTFDELNQAQIVWQTNFIRHLGRIGGKADQLNEYNILLKNPGKFEWDIKRYVDTTGDNLHQYVNKYLSFNKRAVLHIVPQGEKKAGKIRLERSVMPEPAPASLFSPPVIQRSQLSNGLEIWLVEDHKLPLVQTNLLLKSGWSADPPHRPGTASLTAELIDEGTTSRNALQISEDTRRLGAFLTTRSYFDASFVSLNLMSNKLDRGLELFTDLILNPTFPVAELERRRHIYLGRIRQEAKQPLTLAFKMFLRRLYGTQHPYGQPYTGSGTESSIKAITRDDLVNYYQAYYLPNNSAIIMVGDVILDEVKPKLENAFKSWYPGVLHPVVVPEPALLKSRKIYLVDKPGASQSVIVAGNPGLRRNDPSFLAFEVMNNAFGGQFTSRINMNLREEKGYTYEAGSFSMETHGVGPFFCYASVHTKYTSESIREIIKELEDVIGAHPLTDQELTDSKNNLVKGFPQRFQTYSAIASQIGEIIMFNLPVDEWGTYISRANAINGELATHAARLCLKPENLLIVVVGDRKKIEPGIAELKAGEIAYFDSDFLS